MSNYNDLEYYFLLLLFVLTFAVSIEEEIKLYNLSSEIENYILLVTLFEIKR